MALFRTDLTDVRTCLRFFSF